MIAVSVFFSVHLGDELRDDLDALLRLVARRAPAAARVHAADAHLTLAFLGDLAEDRVEAACEAARGLGVPPFDLALGPLGAFGGRAPRVLWWGLEEVPDALADLARALSGALRAVGFAPDDRPFAPHVTLARARGRDAERELAALLRGAAPRPARVRVARFALQRTARGRGVTGEPRYEIVRTFPLSG